MMNLADELLTVPAIAGHVAVPLHRAKRSLRACIMADG
jgi:hypothetical protein